MNQVLPSQSAVGQRRTWAEARLRLGQANVGFWVLASAALLWAQPDVSAATLPGDAASWVLIALAYLLVQLPFDVVGGYTLPVRYGRREPGVGAWIMSWARGVAVHGAALVGVGVGVLAATNAAGVPGGLAVMAASAAVWVAVQGALGRLAAALRRVPASPELESALVRNGLDPARVWVVESQDRSFVGGWVGLLGFERLVLPARWAAELDAAELDAVVRRRCIGRTSGARAQGLALALLFNAVGVGVALALAPGAGLGTAGELLMTSAAITLWGFLGVLTLPTLSRRAVVGLDRLTAAALGDVVGLEHLIRRLDRDQEDEADRGRAVETVFHPVPAPAQRAMALRYPPSGVPVFLPWRVARMSLFTSWATLSFLSRAVHCNIGRPELWVMYPGD